MATAGGDVTATVGSGGAAGGVGAATAGISVAATASLGSGAASAVIVGGDASLVVINSGQPVGSRLARRILGLVPLCVLPAIEGKEGNETIVRPVL
jgi:hypothetical protein